jgi:hypothetical protein
MASMASVHYHEKKLAGLLHVINQITNEDSSDLPVLCTSAAVANLLLIE